MCLLVSNDSKTVFMGGGQDVQGHKAKVIAIDFSSQMTLIDTVLIEEHDQILSFAFLEVPRNIFIVSMTA